MNAKGFDGSVNSKTTPRFVILVRACLAVYALLGGVSCSQKGPAASAPSPDVEVVRVEQKDVPIYGEWIGTLEGLVTAEIKAQVTGYLIKQNYVEGSFVRKGELLFEIDPRPFQASLDQARGSLRDLQGNWSRRRPNSSDPRRRSQSARPTKAELSSTWSAIPRS